MPITRRVEKSAPKPEGPRYWWGEPMPVQVADLEIQASDGWDLVRGQAVRVEAKVPWRGRVSDITKEHTGRVLVHVREPGMGYDRVVLPEKLTVIKETRKMAEEREDDQLREEREARMKARGRKKK